MRHFGWFSNNVILKTWKKKSGLHSVRSPRIFHSSIRCIFQTVYLGNSRTLAPLFLCNFFCWCLFVLYPDPWHFYGSNLWSVQIRGHFQDDAAIKWPFKGKCALLLLVISTHCDVLSASCHRMTRETTLLGKILNANAKMRTKVAWIIIFYCHFKIWYNNFFSKRTKKWKVKNYFGE